MPFFSIIGSSQVATPAIPKWQGGVASASVVDFRLAILRHSPACRFPFVQADAEYCTVPTDVLDAAISITLKTLAAQGISYTKNSWDCEDFVNELHQAIRKIAAKAGILRAPITCGLAVDAKLPFGEVTAPGGHEVACVQTEAGPVIVESQNGQRCAIEAYPNRATLWEVSNL